MLFGNYIRQLRESRSKTLSEAAEALNIPRQKLWDIENNRRFKNKVPRSLIDRFAKVYRVPVGVITEATQIKVAEKKILSEHLADTRPIVARAASLTASLVNDLRSYAPELEAKAIRLYDAVIDLQTRVDNAYLSLYPNTQDKEGSP